MDEHEMGHVKIFIGLHPNAAGGIRITGASGADITRELNPNSIKVADVDADTGVTRLAIEVDAEVEVEAEVEVVEAEAVGASLVSGDKVQYTIIRLKHGSGTVTGHTDMDGWNKLKEAHEKKKTVVVSFYSESGLLDREVSVDGADIVSIERKTP